MNNENHCKMENGYFENCKMEKTCFQKCKTVKIPPIAPLIDEKLMAGGPLFNPNKWVTKLKKKIGTAEK